MSITSQTQANFHTHTWNAQSNTLSTRTNAFVQLRNVEGLEIDRPIHCLITFSRDGTLFACFSLTQQHNIQWENDCSVRTIKLTWLKHSRNREKIPSWVNKWQYNLNVISCNHPVHNALLSLSFVKTPHISSRFDSFKPKPFSRRWYDDETMEWLNWPSIRIAWRVRTYRYTLSRGGMDTFRLGSPNSQQSNSVRLKHFTTCCIPSIATIYRGEACLE